MTALYLFQLLCSYETCLKGEVGMSASQFNELLRTHMQVVGVSAGQLAKLTGLSRATIYNWTSGRSPYPRNWEDIVLLAKVLELSETQTDQLLKSANFPASSLLDTLDVRAQSTLENAAIPPFDHRNFVGIQKETARLIECLCDPMMEQCLSIEGIGGIGKTTLALAIVEAIEESNIFTNILWVSAKQEQLGIAGQIEPLKNNVRTLDDVAANLCEQLGQQQWMGLSGQEQLKRIRPIIEQSPHLIIVDNLETVDEIDLLLPALSQFSPPTRILFTSRQSLQYFPHVRCYKVPPLTLADSQKLLEKEIARRGSNLTIESEQMAQLFAYVGGLPLALKLIAAQLSYLPLSIVVANFSDERPASSTQMYQYIYASTWERLSQAAKALLLSMLDNASSGETFEWVQTMAALPQTSCAMALRELLDYSLLEIGGELMNGLRYRLHRMTVAFLEDIIGRNPASDQPDATWYHTHKERQRNNLQLLPDWIDQNAPETIEAHLPSILTLFEHCRPHADFHELIVILIDKLHPWPVHWGLWSRWRAELLFASDYFHQIGAEYQHALFCLHTARLHLNLGAPAETVALCQQIEQKAADNGWIKLWAMAGELHIQGLRRLNRIKEARSLLVQLEHDIGIAIDEEAISAELLVARAHIIWQKLHFLRLDGRIQEAVDLGRRLVAKLSHYPDIDLKVVANSTHAYSVVLWVFGDYASSIEELERARILNETIGDHVEAIIMRDNIGVVYWSMGELEKAEAVMQESLRMMRAINAQANINRLIGNLALIYMSNGEVDQAVHLLQEQLRLAILLDDQHEADRANENLGTMYLCQEKYEEVLDIKACFLSDEKDPSSLTRLAVYIEMSDTYLALGDRETAQHYISQAKDLYPQIDSVCAEIFTLRAMARHYADDRACNLLAQAVHLSTTSNRRLDLAACYLDLIPHCDCQAEKIGCWNKAQSLLESMQATAWLRGRSIDNLPYIPYLY